MEEVKLKKKKKYLLRIFLSFLAIPLYYLLSMLAGGGHGNLMPVHLLFFPIIGCFGLIGFIIRPILDLDLAIFELIIEPIYFLAFIITYALAFFWFYSIGITIGFMKKRLEWEKAKIFVFIQIGLLFISIFDFFFVNREQYMRKHDWRRLSTSTFTDYDYWIIGVLNSAYFILLLILVFRHYKQKFLKHSVLF
jgi:hypothetical protein